MTTAHSTPKVPINSIHVTEKAASKVREFATRDGKDQFGLKVAYIRLRLVMAASFMAAPA